MRANTTAVVVLLVLVSAVRVEGQASLDAARDLYASAEYDRALTMLDGLLAAEHPRDEQRSIELYRVLCLVATGREADATGAIETLIARNPLYRPSADVPPRVRSTFDEARRRLLPAAIQTAYQGAKAAYDSQDYATARRGFAEVLEVLADPDMAVLATQSPLSDLRMLASGFHELSAKAPVPSEPVPVAPPPAPIALEPPPSNVAKIYSAHDTNVVPPIVVNQRIPAFPGPVRSRHAGVVEVIIDGTGAVESAMMLEPINPQYDRLTLTAAKGWQYVPARVDGVPVKFAKRIQVTIVPNPSERR